MSPRFSRLAFAAAAVATTATIAVAPAATAAPATSPAPSTTQQAGDGVWSPSHDEKLALIPVCSGPAATSDWLYKNFTDHGRDIRSASDLNKAAIVSILRFSPDPFGLLKLAFRDVLQAPVYAVNDVKFHQTATVADILTFCKSAR